MPDRPPARLWTICARVDLGLFKSVSVSVSVSTFEPDPVVFAFNEDSTSKGTWRMVLLIV